MIYEQIIQYLEALVFARQNIYKLQIRWGGK